MHCDVLQAEEAAAQAAAARASLAERELQAAEEDEEEEEEEEDEEDAAGIPSDLSGIPPVDEADEEKPSGMQVCNNNNNSICSGCWEGKGISS